MANGRDDRGIDDDDEDAGAPSASDTVWDAQAWAAATPAADRQHLKVEPELWRPEEDVDGEVESPGGARARAPALQPRPVPWGWIAVGVATAWLVRRAVRRARV